MNTTRTRILSRNNRGARIVAMVGATFLPWEFLRRIATGHALETTEGVAGMTRAPEVTGHAPEMTGPALGNSAPRTFAPIPRSGYVDRSIHGSIRHAETHAVPWHSEPERHSRDAISRSTASSVRTAMSFSIVILEAVFSGMILFSIGISRLCR